MSLDPGRVFPTNQSFIVVYAAAAAAKSLPSCPTLSNPLDCSPPGSSVHGIFQARVLEWGAIAFSQVVLVARKKKKQKKNLPMQET